MGSILKLCSTYNSNKFNDLFISSMICLLAPYIIHGLFDLINVNVCKCKCKFPWAVDILYIKQGR